MTWKRPIPRRFNVEYTWSVCREVTPSDKCCTTKSGAYYNSEHSVTRDQIKKDAEQVYQCTY